MKIKGKYVKVVIEREGFKNGVDEVDQHIYADSV